MSYEVVDITGTAQYPKLFDFNRDPGAKKEDGAPYDFPECTSIQLLLDQDELTKISRANPNLKPRIKENGLEVKFRRKWNDPIGKELGGEPVVKDSEGNPWDRNVMIGNGSKVRAAVQVYDTKFGKGMRLLGVQVLELVEPDLPEQGSTPELPF